MIIHELDNVEVNLENGHKYAIRDIKKGENIIKYGNPIGHATEDIKVGDHVHSHNVKTNLSGNIEYKYEPVEVNKERIATDKTFMGYVRKNGDVGIRNEIWIINTVGCVNKVAKKLAALTGAIQFEHPFGCSQLGGDHKTTQLILRGLINHPNAAGVLVLGLGCENNNIDEFKKVLGEYDAERVKFLNCQDFDDEIAEGHAHMWLNKSLNHELELRGVEKHSEFQIWHNYINITQPFAYCLTVMGFLNFKFAKPVDLK